MTGLLSDVQVIRTKRSPPIWAVKAGARYVAHFSGRNAERQATEHAQEHYGDHARVIPEPRRRVAKPEEPEAETGV